MRPDPVISMRIKDTHKLWKLRGKRYISKYWTTKACHILFLPKCCIFVRRAPGLPKPAKIVLLKLKDTFSSFMKKTNFGRDVLQDKSFWHSYQEKQNLRRLYVEKSLVVSDFCPCRTYCLHIFLNNYIFAKKSIMTKNDNNLTAHLELNIPRRAENRPSCFHILTWLTVVSVCLVEHLC